MKKPGEVEIENAEARGFRSGIRAAALHCAFKAEAVHQRSMRERDRHISETLRAYRNAALEIGQDLLDSFEAADE